MSLSGGSRCTLDKKEDRVLFSKQIAAQKLTHRVVQLEIWFGLSFFMLLWLLERVLHYQLTPRISYWCGFGGLPLQYSAVRTSRFSPLGGYPPVALEL